MVSNVQNLHFGPASLSFWGSLCFFWLFDQKYPLFMPKLKTSMSFCHTTLSDDRAKRARSNGMLLVSGKWNGEKLLNKYWIGPKSHLSKNGRSSGLWCAIWQPKRFSLAICKIFVVFWVDSVRDSHRYPKKTVEKPSFWRKSSFFQARGIRLRKLMLSNATEFLPEAW
jgi:hypothetical protein